MADDPNRDIWPVRDSSVCMDTCRSVVDPRERHVVCKLDRYQLEDKYLRLLDEACNLKKLSNSQEDKIKRLATKLMRITTNPRACPVALDAYEHKNKIIALELENTKLKDKIAVLRNQMLSHRIGSRSSSRSRNAQTRPSSGRITCRSENSRTKIASCHCIVQTASDDSNARNSLEKIEELEAQKEEMSERIAQLEKELSTASMANQKEKVAENVEHIKVWRQAKQLNDKLIAVETENEVLSTQISDLNNMLEEKIKINEEISAELVEEKKRRSEIDEQMLKAKNSEHSLREKDERINDLINEVKILQQHNKELVDLSSKYGEFEQENKELKKKINEQSQDQQMLRNVVNAEQANIAALQSSNQQLLGKLEELQKNIDSLTIQLTSFRTQTEKNEMPKATQISTKLTNINIPITANRNNPYKDVAVQVEKCNKCCDTSKDMIPSERIESCKKCSDRYIHATGKGSQLLDKSIQTDVDPNAKIVYTKNQGTSAMTPVKEKPRSEEPQFVTQHPDASTTQTLTPQKMLKLLDQAQIKQTTQKTVKSDVILDRNQGHSDTEAIAQATQAKPTLEAKQQQTNKETFQALDKKSMETDKILTTLIHMLQDQSLMYVEDSNLYQPGAPTQDQMYKDVNNNIDTPLQNMRSGCSTKKSCSIPCSRQHQEKMKRTLFSGLKKYNHQTKVLVSNECNCNDFIKCNPYKDCQNQCCTSPILTQDLQDIDKKSTENKKNLMKELKTFPQNNLCNASVRNCPTGNLCTTYTSRQLQDEGKPFKSWEASKPLQKDDDPPKPEESLNEYVKHLDKCREFMNGVSGISVKEIVDHAKIMDPLESQSLHKHCKVEAQRGESLCSIDCSNDCIEVISSPSGSFPLVIGDGQGLLELHIVSLQLSTSAKQVLFREKSIGHVSLFVSWEMWNQEIAYTPTLKCPKLNFNSSFVYRIADLVSFFNFVLMEFVIFHVNVYHDDSDSYVVARGKLCIKDILDYPQNKLYYIAPVNSVIPCSNGDNFGQLSLWVRLSCDIEKVEAFANKWKSHCEVAEKHTANAISTEKIVSLAKNDLVAFKDGNSTDYLPQHTSEELIVTKSVLQMDNSSDSSEELQVPAKEMEKRSLSIVKEDEENSDSPPLESQRLIEVSKLMYKEDINWNKTSNDIDSGLSVEVKETAELPKKEKEDIVQSSSVLEFNKIVSNNIPQAPSKDSSIESISEVTDIITDKNWKKYKERSLLTFSESGTEQDRLLSEIDIPSDTFLEKDTIIIEIVSMILLPKTSVMQNEEYQLFYIEYSFLGYCGADMETASVQKPQPPERKLTYHFRRKFRVDQVKHALQNSILRAMLEDASNPNIKFIVVCEPLPEETDIKECVEIGYATLNIREYALGNTEKVVSLPIYSVDENKQIGLLKICLLGRDTLRQYLGRRESNL